MADSVVSVGDCLIVFGAGFEDGEFLGQVAREEGEERDYGQDDVADEGVGAGGECGGEAVEMEG